jgi:hypothetical protein
MQLWHKSYTAPYAIIEALFIIIIVLIYEWVMLEVLI